MIRSALIFLAGFLWLALSSMAAADEPVLQLEMEETEAVPGQSLSLRLTVLVPTFLPDPPVWPSLEAPNLAVRVASTGPTSAQVDGDTWSGVTRRYLLSPMVPGTVALPAQSVTVTWADPVDTTPRTVELTTDPLSVTGVVPEGAEGLDPFLAAEALDLTQTVDGETEWLSPGASVVRTVTATIRGTPAMFLPPLLPPHQVEGMRAYPDEAVLDETENRGVLSGTRTERVTLVAEGGGTGEAPAIALDWYNLTTGAVETATLEAIPLSVDGPPATTTVPGAQRDWRSLVALALALVIGAALVGGLWRWAVPPLRRWMEGRRNAYATSEAYAYLALEEVVRRKDYAALFPALDIWIARLPASPYPGKSPAGLGLEDALSSLGAARYTSRQGDGAAGWRSLASALPIARKRALQHSAPALLPPLNPRSA